MYGDINCTILYLAYPCRAHGMTAAETASVVHYKSNEGHTLAPLALGDNSFESNWVSEGAGGSAASCLPG